MTNSPMAGRAPYAGYAGVTGVIRRPTLAQRAFCALEASSDTNAEPSLSCAADLRRDAAHPRR